MAEVTPYAIIIEKVDAGRISEAVSAFNSALGMESDVAEKILQSAPVIFIRNLSKTDVKGLVPALTTISECGVEFRITTKTAKLPKVNWPLKPHFISGGKTTTPAFDWNDMGFVCPGCGESFVFKQIGKVQLYEPPESARTEETSTVKKEVTSTFQKPQPAPQVQTIQPKPQLPAPKAPEKPKTSRAPVVEEPPVEEIPAEPEILEIAESPLEPAGNPNETVTEVEPLSLEPEEVVEDSGNADGAGTVSESISDALEAPVPEKPKAPAVVGGDAFNVFINKVANSGTKKQVAELMTKYRGGNVQDALKRLDQSVVIKFAESVSKEQADQISRELKRLSITARVLQVKK